VYVSTEITCLKIPRILAGHVGLAPARYAAKSLDSGIAGSLLKGDGCGRQSGGWCDNVLRDGVEVQAET